MPSVAVNPEKILRELRELWVDWGKKQEVPGGVLRACSMTLVTVSDSFQCNSPREDVQAVHQTIGQLMHEHPSRAIVISPQDGAELSARVFSECWMPYHGRQQICAEGIEITADCEQMDEVSRLLRALIAPDLPVILWCRGPRAFLDRTLDPLFPMAHKIIFNTEAARNVPSAIEFLRRLHQAGHGVADLAWTRLTGWRENIAALFDAATGRPEQFPLVRVLHAGARPSSEAIYLARWIDRVCDGASVILEPVESNLPGTAGVIFSAPHSEISLLRKGETLEAHSNGRVFTSALPRTSEEAAMREELSILDRDPVFHKVIL